ncbi:CGNR zinc finger domain-containing protein [Nesterenkonia muleiensis]|uniref:CGNR zinc finger domain-containing protein n=1 Tax=Nesterenkonia muleiensis TaxID=2282648 RepID=UPI001EE45D59|nr:CGNR zinc finger domain-containing protein [Nesterenkonia muleiensis]
MKQERTAAPGVMMIEDEDLLMAVLNSAPVIRGKPTDQLDGSTGNEILQRFGGEGTEAELLHLRRTRDALQGMIREESDAVEQLTAAIDKAALVPEVTGNGLQWQLDAPADERLSARTVLAWSRVAEQFPGRLRACANTECNLFLIDHSRPGTAKWCSMATCGNRMKARAHARRT